MSSCSLDFLWNTHLCDNKSGGLLSGDTVRTGCLATPWNWVGGSKTVVHDLDDPRLMTGQILSSKDPHYKSVRVRIVANWSSTRIFQIVLEMI